VNREPQTPDQLTDELVPFANCHRKVQAAAQNNVSQRAANSLVHFSF